MKILITGATGFIGSSLIKSINKKENKIAIISRDRKNIENINIIKGNLNNLKTLEKKIIKFNPEIVIHLAWENIPKYTFENSKKNLDNSINFLNIIIDKTDCKKIIVSGSCWEYGVNKGVCKEKNKIKINNYFSWAKTSLYNFLNMKKNYRDFNLIWLRLFYVYGVGQRKDSLIPYIVNQIKMNKKPILSSLKNKNDYININDVSRIILYSIFNNIKSGIYNVGNGKSYSVKYIYKIISKILKKNIRLNNDVKNINFTDFYSSNIKFKKEFKITNNISISKGISEYIKNTKFS